MVFNAIFNSISVILRHLSMLSWSFFNQHITIVETMDNGERGMNPVAMTIINPRKEYWPSRRSNQQPPFLSLQRYRLSYGALLVAGNGLKGQKEQV